MADRILKTSFPEPGHPRTVDERYHVLNDWNVAEIMYWQSLLSLLDGVDGTIVECGIGRGRSLLIVSLMLQLMDVERDLIAYDSFEGFPEPSKEDTSSRKPKKGEWAYSPSGKFKYDPDFIYDVLEHGGVLEARRKVTLVKGFFSDTLSAYAGGPIALLHVDCDLYQSHLDVLSNLYDHVQPGGLVVFDDFILNNDDQDIWPGARQAVTEFLSDKNQRLIGTMVGSPYLIKS